MKTKAEMIREMQGAGVFSLVCEALDIINADNKPNHIKGNKSLHYFLTCINDMQSWNLFDWKLLIDYATRAVGVARFSWLEDADICADVSEPLWELHRILWEDFSDFGAE